MTILEALADRNLFGSLPAFRDLETWTAWRAFLASVYGLPRPGGYSEAVAIVGRQSGKTRLAAAIATFEAISAEREPGSDLFAVLVAQDQRAALRTSFRYASAPFEASAILKRSIVSQTADTQALETGVTLAAYPCRPAAVRGLRALVVVVDELAFFISTDGRPTDTEMLRALRPCLATTGGKLIVLSSPYAQSGALWDLHRKHYGRDDSSTLCWTASAPEMNPTLPADYLERMKQDDPEAYRSEVLGKFRAGVSTFLDSDALEACVADRRELQPADGLSLRRVHRSEGRGQGRIHGGDCSPRRRRARDRRLRARMESAVQPCGRGRGVRGAAENVFLPGSDGRSVCRRMASGSLPLSLDRIRSGRSRSLSPLPRADTACECGDGGDPERCQATLAELRGLERRRGTAGRDRVDHRPGSHDDRANSVAGVVYLAGARDFYDIDLLADMSCKPTDPGTLQIL
jgi:hypothetical protein